MTTQCHTAAWVLLIRCTKWRVTSATPHLMPQLYHCTANNMVPFNQTLVPPQLRAMSVALRVFIRMTLTYLLFKPALCSPLLSAGLPLLCTNHCVKLHFSLRWPLCNVWATVWKSPHHIHHSGLYALKCHGHGRTQLAYYDRDSSKWDLRTHRSNCCA